MGQRAFASLLRFYKSSPGFHKKYSLLVFTSGDPCSKPKIKKIIKSMMSLKFGFPGCIFSLKAVEGEEITGAILLPRSETNEVRNLLEKKVELICERVAVED